MSWPLMTSTTLNFVLGTSTPTWSASVGGAGGFSAIWAMTTTSEAFISSLSVSITPPQNGQATSAAGASQAASGITSEHQSDKRRMTELLETSQAPAGSSFTIVASESAGRTGERGQESAIRGQQRHKAVRQRRSG